MRKCLAVLITMFLLCMMSFVASPSQSDATQFVSHYSSDRDGKGTPRPHAHNDKGHGKPREVNPPRFANNDKPKPVAPQNNNGNSGKPKPTPPKLPPKAKPHPHAQPKPQPKPPRKKGGGSQVRRNPAPQPLVFTTPGLSEFTPESQPRPRQPKCSCGNIVKKPEKVGFWSPEVDFGDGETTVGEVSLGLVTVLALVGLLLLAMYSGYILGYKDKERKDTDFMRALLEAIALRKSKSK